ncbi:hypothetical protein LRS13_09315 [Svornostia abyssi]|uniref:Uncharacterized protein n=1 Tax=Svornostia abyssi TaxID=2898438 RepID=A0ABY5PLY0_9ACTN|nr:hypothetical protein LRS13_09315 [Parviterribacteraceae bacterium J379]
MIARAPGSMFMTKMLPVLEVVTTVDSGPAPMISSASSAPESVSIDPDSVITPAATWIVSFTPSLWFACIAVSRLPSLTFVPLFGHAAL